MAPPFLQLHLAKDAWNSVVCKPAKTTSLKKGRIDHFKPLGLPAGDAWNLTIPPNPPLKKYVLQHVASQKAYQRKKRLSLRREILVAPAWCTSDPIDSDALKVLFLYFFWEEAVEECEVLWDTSFTWFIDSVGERMKSGKTLAASWKRNKRCTLLGKIPPPITIA